MKIAHGWLAAALLLLLASCNAAPQRPKPQLFLLTPLPLLWSEQFSLEESGSETLKQLQQAYRVTPIDLPSQLPAGGLLLAAQPRALPANELVALDSWVRAGGRVLLLADPLLEWPSRLPAGDRRRPPIVFADTGLLRHWGLRLDAPATRGPKQAKIDGRPLLAVSPGTLAAVSGPCRVADMQLVAQCRIGRGQATVIADADWLNVGSDLRDDDNLLVLESQLERLSR